YLSPLDGEPCTALDIARLLAARRRRDAETEGVTHVLGVNRLKRVQIRPFVEGKRSRVTWTMKPDDALAWQRADGGRIVSWASREPVDFHAACKAQGAPHIRLEDGFLRSVGLGANLELPASLVLDDQGIYYDPRTPSGLETLLQTAVFDAETLYRASALRDAIRAARVSKYNVGGGEVAELFANAGKRSKVLVPAQVEADASVLLGGGDIQTNLALLQAVRTARPDAFIVFKPHPDVEAGIRPGAVPRGVALTLADVIAEKAAMPDLLDQVDEVHTLTSLSGFEALLRDVPVIAYGSPFYAGWGLTEDRQNFPHRSRRLSPDELVAGTLLLYPRYTHRPSDWPCEAEDVVRQLQFSLRKKGAEGLIGRRRALTMLRQLMGRPPK
ncbi:MAG: capsular polysaccharide export protein, LipB/KpsS family, partial [Caulobacteraceae bacterium]